MHQECVEALDGYVYVLTLGKLCREDEAATRGRKESTANVFKQVSMHSNRFENACLA